MLPMTSCSSTMPATACRWRSTVSLANGAPRRSSSRCLAHQASPTRRRPRCRGSLTGHRPCRRLRQAIGIVPALLAPGQHQSRDDQGQPLRSADQPQLRRHVGALRHRHFYRQSDGGQGTRPKSSRRSSRSSAGCSGGRAAASSTASPRSTRRPPSCSPGSTRNGDRATRRDPPQALGGGRPVRAKPRRRRGPLRRPHRQDFSGG